MDRRSNCYLNSAYNRNIDDFDDYVDNDSQLSFDSRGRSYESENEAYVDEFLDDENSCYSDGNRLDAFDQDQIDNRSFSLQQLQRYHNDSCSKSTDLLTSTPKKQQYVTPSSLKNPQRRAAIARHRSFSALSRRENGRAFVDNNYHRTAIRRSKSSLSLRPQPRFEYQRYAAAAVPAPVHLSVGYPNDVHQRTRNLLNVTEPALRLPNVSSVSPFQIRQKSDMFTARNPFLRRPYDLNSSFSSSRPLVSRNTAVISPIYNKKSIPSPFDVDHSRTFAVSPTDRSVNSSSKMSWLQMRRQSLPLWTLRTSAITLLLCGTISCLLCIHIVSQRGKSYELTFGLISGFVTLWLGFPCLRFKEWQWLPNRNYVTGYILLGIFSVLQATALWVLDKYPDLRPDFTDIIKGAICGLSSLSLSIALFGVCSSCCCKYPPPDNRVTHGVQGFTV